MSKPYKLLVEHVTQLVQVSSCGARALTKDRMKEIAVLEGNTEGYSLLVDKEGNIADIGCSQELSQKYRTEDIDLILDGTGKCLLPGLVDAHTHPVWAGDRVHEFAMKLAGATYMDIHNMGGGIHYSVHHTKMANEEALFLALRQRLRQMVEAGSTLVECKSGYGLNLETELKLLRVIERARREGRISVSSTYCGAHAVPEGMTSTEATEDIISNHIPTIKEKVDQGHLRVDNIDVFCELGVFDVDQSRRILQAGLQLGWMINFHGEELHQLGSAEMGASLTARSISHLEEISPAGIQAMARSGTAAIVLPTTAYNLRLKPPPVRDMIDAGIVVALGSDFNPNAYCLAMPLVMNLACILFKMSMPEALVAATLNAAYALGRSDTHGSLEVGKRGNFLLVDAPSWEHLIYQMGNHSNIISAVVWKGEIVHQKVKV